MKKFVAFMLFMSFLFVAFTGFGPAVSAAVTPKLYLNGELVEAPVAPQLVENKYTVVPIRIISEGLGMKVTWSQADKTATIKSESDTIVLKINESVADVNGNQAQMDTPAIVQSGTTLVPLRFVGESMGLEVKWDNTAKAAYVSGEVSEETPGEETEADGRLTSISYDETNGVTVSYEGTVEMSKPMVLDNPKRLVFDFENTDYAEDFQPAMSLTTMMGEIAVSGHDTLTKIRYSLFSAEPPTARIVLDLSGSSTYSVSEGEGEYRIKVEKDTSTGNDSGSGTAPETPTTPPDSGSGKKYTVVIDAGHGGSDPGAQSVNSRWEKEVNLSIALKIKALLDKEPNIDLQMTRTGDTYPSLQDRVDFAEKANADIFISIHANSATPSASGTETYYTHENSKKLAETVHKYLVKGTGLKDRGVKTANYFVTRETTMPAILLETGFLTNAGDAAVLYSSEKQQDIAEQIVIGIKEYLGVS
ncbi:N-acetylmuramoyl-L-alanine amidase [Paenibacillus thailandensis]|uniref:N-acetylmuramoyl-L-alanine amidase n=1 Tax=Paenibacillus thailandensis TaxID=393250 RepID=A0ABW5R0A0_9BACL